MRWTVIRHPETDGVGVIAETALEMHEARGWVRTSDWADDPTELNPADHPLPETEPEPKPKASAKTSSKEN